MAVLEIIKMGDPKLGLKSTPVTDFKSEELQILIVNMIETMRIYQGVGLAAPQIGVSKQIVILEVAQNARYPHADNIELDVLINPKIIDYSVQNEFDWEGCLSLPGLRGQVQRSKRISYEAYDREGRRVNKTVHGFHARIIQHEVDHLNGILYPQKLSDFKKFGFEDSLPTFLETTNSANP
ncbi:MAG: peptide deformylase [Gammaproteobacteria bacterium]|nr:peptide deformylase [Gammaproteobacteria bacterium]